MSQQIQTVLPCGHSAGFRLTLHDGLGSYESVCLKCLNAKLAQEPQAQVFSEYRHTTDLNDPDVKGWTFIETFYTSNIIPASEEIESGCQQNNYTAKFRNKAVVTRTARFLFGKPVNMNIQEILEARKYKDMYEIKREVHERNLESRARAIQDLKTKLEQAEVLHAQSLGVEIVLRKKAQELTALERKEKEALAEKLKKLEDLETQEPLRVNLPALRPLEPEA